MALSKATILVENTGESFPVMFNPEEGYTLSHDNNFASQTVPGLSAPILQFVNGNMRTLEMELFFDTTDDRTDVRLSLRKLTDLLKISSELHAPPVVVVSWGSLHFRSVLARASQQFVRFLEDGRPVRARINATFNEFVDPGRESRQVNRQTADYSKIHIGAEGESLQGIAAQFYGDPRMWRAIAIENEIDDPLREFTGESLRIPSLPMFDRGSGELIVT